MRLVCLALLLPFVLAAPAGGQACGTIQTVSASIVPGMARPPAP
jgi:hypothetical protein